MPLTIDELATFCKKKGIVFPTAEMYNSLSGFFDYGPLGVEIKNNLKKSWWNTFVQQRDDVVGIDGAIITNPKVWKASGHVDNFEDILVEDTKTKERFRADHLVEDALKIEAHGLRADDLWKLIQENNIKSPKGNPLTSPKQFNLMFNTNIGPIQSDNSRAYMRPETAQSIFINFKLVQESSRLKLPFGIAQVGKAFRNEISPRDFLFRSREFEQMEIEYFIDPKEKSTKIQKQDKVKFQFLSREEQAKKTPKNETATAGDLVKQKKLLPIHGYWLVEAFQWYINLGIDSKNLRIREHTKDELSHYSSATFDIEYNFPFGWKEIHGSADRGNFDLTQHEKIANTKLRVFNEETKEHILPSVIEPSWGVDRALLAFLFEAYDNDQKRGNVVLKLHPKLVPIQIGIFPLVKNKPEIVALAEQIHNDLRLVYTTQYDESGSVGRRYARADEQGILLGCTIDFDSLNDNCITLRHRDTTKQIRVPIKQLRDIIFKIINGEQLEKLGKLV